MSPFRAPATQLHVEYRNGHSGACRKDGVRYFNYIAFVTFNLVKVFGPAQRGQYLDCHVSVPYSSARERAHKKNNFFYSAATFVAATMLVFAKKRPSEHSIPPRSIFL